MARSKSPSQIRHRKIRKLSKGFKQSRRVRVKAGKEAVMHAGKYAYIGRKLKKRNFRKLWIIRLSAFAKANNTSYSKMISDLKKKNIEIDRKILSDIAIKDPDTLKYILEGTK